MRVDVIDHVKDWTPGMYQKEPSDVGTFWGYYITDIKRTGWRKWECLIVLTDENGDTRTSARVLGKSRRNLRQLVDQIGYDWRVL